MKSSRKYLSLEIISVKQYKEAIENCLSDRQYRILKALSTFPESTASPSQLAKKLGYKDRRAANLQIGIIGRKIYEYLNIKPLYRSDGSAIYYRIIGEYYKENDGVRDGWKIHKNLCKALTL